MKRKICLIHIIAVVLIFSWCFSVSADSAGWITYIQSGKPFYAVFDLTHNKFDDSVYTGNWKTDPMGTLKGGETYHVTYTNKNFICKGFNQDTNEVGTWTYYNADPADNIISLWGLLFVFDGKGRLYDSRYGLVGHLEKTSDGASSTPEPKSVPPQASGKSEWNTSFNTMHIVQQGKTISGSYDYAGGKIIGRFEGRTFYGWWYENDDTSDCGPNNSWSGPLVLHFSEDGKSFSGNYGKCSDGQRSFSSVAADRAWNGNLINGSIDF